MVNNCPCLHGAFAERLGIWLSQPEGHIKCYAKMKIIVDSAVYDSQQIITLRKFLHAISRRVNRERLSDVKKKELTYDIVAIIAGMLDGSAVWHQEEDPARVRLGLTPLQPMLMFAQDEDQKEIVFSEESAALSDLLDDVASGIIGPVDGEEDDG